MKSDDDLHALAALAEAATLGPWTAEDGDGMPGYDGMANVYGAPEEMGTVDRPSQRIARVTYTQEDDDARFIAAASPDVVRELVERTLKAEAIVRDLAADDIGVDNDGNCPLCGQYAMGFKETQHAESCPWRRAVDLKI